jgi:hypothetical protein
MGRPGDILLFSTLVLASLTRYAVAITTAGEQLATFLPPESVPEAYFGGAIAISNNVVIGSSLADEGDGSVSIYEKGSSMFEYWPGTVVTPPTGSSADGFGESVAIATYSDYMVAFIGAPKDATSGVATGAVYVYERKGSWWEYTQRLSVSGLNDGDRFGASLSVNGNRLLIGAHYGDSETVG